METEKLRHFLAVLEWGTLNRASQEVHLTQSALSRSIQSLERELGIPLFDRLGSTVKLTPYGKIVAEEAHRLIRTEREIAKRIDLFKAGRTGEIAVGFSPTAASLILKSYLVLLGKLYPRLLVTVQMDSTVALLEQLRAEKLDAFVGDARAVEDTDLTVIRLPELRVGLICRSGHPLLKDDPVPISRAMDYPLASYSLSGAAARHLEKVVGYKGRAGGLLSILCESLEILKQVVLESDVIMLSPVAVVQDEIAAGRMQSIRFPEPPKHHHQYALVKLADRTTHPAIDHLAKHARAALGSVKEAS